MNKLLGEPQTPRMFWLVLLLAVVLLLGISASPAKAASDPRLARTIETLLALGEALQESGSRPHASPVHPELADGGSVWLRNVSVRQVRALQRRLAATEPGRSLQPQPLAHRILAIEADRLHWQLLAFSSPEDDAARLKRSFARLAAVPVSSPPQHATARTSPVAAGTPRLLRGGTL